MSDLTDRYLAAWNATDPTTRKAAVEDAFTAEITYVDPLVDVFGHDQLEATIAAVQGQFRGFVFTLLDEPDSHHDVVRFRWGLGPAGGEPLVEGFDVATLDGRRIATVTGFLDKVPA
ncbi:MAG: polyketide cyclase [Frankiales bacterium]|nr:polyketide cyclase [Frankiales bacterium]